MHWSSFFESTSVSHLKLWDTWVGVGNCFSYIWFILKYTVSIFGMAILVSFLVEKKKRFILVQDKRCYGLWGYLFNENIFYTILVSNIIRLINFSIIFIYLFCFQWKDFDFIIKYYVLYWKNTRALLILFMIVVLYTEKLSIEFHREMLVLKKNLVVRFRL